MFRKLAFAFVGAVSLGVAALAPGAASAHDWGGGGDGRWGGGWHRGWHDGRHDGWHGGWRHGPRLYGYGGPGYGGGCWVRRPVPTPWGMRWRLVDRCS